MLLPGKQFEFDTLFQDDTKGRVHNFGPITLYQVGELSASADTPFLPISSGAMRSAM